MDTQNQQALRQSTDVFNKLRKQAEKEPEKIVQIAAAMGPRSHRELFALTNKGRIFSHTFRDYLPEDDKDVWDWAEMDLPNELKDEECSTLTIKNTGL